MTGFAGALTFEISGNPFWEMLVRLLGFEPQPGTTINPNLRLRDPELKGLPLRAYFLSRFCHTIIDPELDLRLLTWLWEHGKKSGVVSIGAGTGYLEALVNYYVLGGVSFDKYPPDRYPNEYHGSFDVSGSWGPTSLFSPVREGGPEMAALYPKLTLLLSWPPPGPMAFDALQAYTGNLCIYIGEWGNPEQNGSQPFFDAVAARWEIIDDYLPVRWFGSNDVVLLLRRQQSC